MLETFNFENSYIVIYFFTIFLFIIFLFLFLFIGLIRYGKRLCDKEWHAAAVSGNIILRNKKRHGYKVILVYSSNQAMNIPDSQFDDN